MQGVLTAPHTSVYFRKGEAIDADRFLLDLDIAPTLRAEVQTAMLALLAGRGSSDVRCPDSPPSSQQQLSLDQLCRITAALQETDRLARAGAHAHRRPG